MDLIELKRLHDKAYTAGQVTRERAADDLVFYWVTQWDDNILADSQLAYRGEFNILRKAGRQILSDLAMNQVQVDFEPVDETADETADLMDGLYRTDDNRNISQEAYENASQEQVVCGVGAWELYTEYVSTRSGNKNQVIKRRPIYEANNTVYFDPNSKLLDKSNAMYCSVLSAYSEDGYKKLVKDLTGEELTGGIDGNSFKHPEQSYVFPWVGGEGKKIYIVNFYHRELVTEKILTMVDPFGQLREVNEADLLKIMDELLDAGFSVESEKTIERWKVTKYIASGADILDESVIAGTHIPVVPQYGEHAYVEGEEHYEGVTRLAKDPQRLRNFQLSYLADIVSRSPRQKPIFMQEQIATFEDMYSEVGSENNYPYLLQNRMAGDGTQLPIGPVGIMPETPIPSALIQSIALSKEAVEDVANPGMPQDVADPDLSGKAILALQARMDMQSVVYQEHVKHAKRRDAEIYAGMVVDVYDAPRSVKLTMPDDSRKNAEIMETVIDEESGDIVTLNDLNGAEFEVYSKIGASYSSQKEQTIERLEGLIAGLPIGDPKREILLLKLLKLMDGVDFDDVRDYANKQLILSGVKEPETDEEIQMLADAQQQGQEPSAEMVLALAEDKKGQAMLLKEQREGVDMQLKAQNEEMKRQIDAFKAQSERMGIQVDAQEAGANIDYKRVDTFGKKLENTEKIIQLRQPKDMTSDELYSQIAAG